MTRGISTSMATSPTMHSGLSSAAHLYSRMHRESLLIMDQIPP